MTLPDLSKLMDMARLRYIQSVHERTEWRNPDFEVRHFIPLLRRVRLRWLRASEVNRLRETSFYYHLIARTLYYDQLVQGSLDQGVRHFVNIGCGTDTRAHRFRGRLGQAGATVLEMDQSVVIQAKRRIATWVWPADAVDYLELDLNSGRWSALQRRLQAFGNGKVLVMVGSPGTELEFAL